MALTLTAAIAAFVLGGSLPAPNRAVTHSHPVEFLEVTNAADDITFAVHVGSGPDSTLAISGAMPIGDAVEIVPSTDPGPHTAIRFRIDRPALPAETNPCVTPTADINLGVAVFDTVWNLWLPLPTTCLGDMVEAVVPHYSWFQVYILEPGTHVVHTVVGGEVQTVELVTDISTSLISYVAELLTEVLAAVFRNGLGIFDPAKYVCSPPGASRTAEARDRLAGLVEACTVSGPTGDRLHVKNGYAYPISFRISGDAAKYLRRVDDTGSFDLIVAGEQLAAAMFDRSLLTGLSQGVFEIADGAPAEFAISGDFDVVAWTFDIALAVVTTILTVARASATAVSITSRELNVILQRVRQEVIARGTRDRDSVVNIVADLTKEKPSWRSYASAVRALVDAANCAGNVQEGKPVDIALACTSTALKGLGSYAADLLVMVATQAKALPELAQGNVANMAMLAGLTRVDVTVSSRWKDLVGYWSGIENDMEIRPDGTGKLEVVCADTEIFGGTCSGDLIHATFRVTGQTANTVTAQVINTDSTQISGALRFELEPGPPKVLILSIDRGWFFCKHGEQRPHGFECA